MYVTSMGRGVSPIRRSTAEQARCVACVAGSSERQPLFEIGSIYVIIPSLHIDYVALPSAGQIDRSHARDDPL